MPCHGENEVGGMPGGGINFRQRVWGPTLIGFPGQSGREKEKVHLVALKPEPWGFRAHVCLMLGQSSLF